MTHEGSPADPIDEQLLTPEQLVVLNIEALMKARRVTRSELAKRLNDLGFETWRHEKTIRNLFDGVRSLRVDELFAMAAALNTTVFALTSTETRRRVFPEEEDPGPRMSLGTAVRGFGQYGSVWFFSLGIDIPNLHLDWAAWRPDTKPAWANMQHQRVESIIRVYTMLGFEAPTTPIEDLTTEQLEEMVGRITMASAAEDPA